LSSINLDSGSGKTEIIHRIIVKAKQQGIPVFYSAASERQYEAKLKTELGYFTLMTQFFHYVKKLLSVDSSNDILKDLEKVGKEIKKKTNKRPLLIIDNCHQLCATDEGKQLLRNLQEMAKKMADDEALNIIFVVTTDDGQQVHRDLMKREFSSRMRMYHVEEMTEEEATNYLNRKFGIHDQKQIAEIMKVAGRVPKYLNDYNQLEQVTLALNEKFIQNKVDPIYNTNFREISKEIIQKKSIDIHDFEGKTPPVDALTVANGISIIQPTPNPLRVAMENDVIFTRWGREVKFKNSAIQQFVMDILTANK